MADPRRTVPSVDRLLRSEPGKRAAAALGRPALKQALVETLAEVRRDVAAGEDVPIADEILATAAGRASRIVNGLTPVINATGVVLHTNLGRAPLPERAVTAVRDAARSYVDLEVDRTTGLRGKRTSRAEALLTALTGAPDAVIVNNGAAALLLTLAALAKGKQVLVSRGELIEIGGEFRIPDILRAAGVRLIEVGTTNRTRIGDYRAAMTDRTGAILKVHPSNYKVVGFTAAASTKDLAKLSGQHEVPLIYDVGSGLLAHTRGMPPDEPSVADALADGADLVLCSGDKLLGGPQAGLVLGRHDLVATIKKHPMARAVRVDKLQVAAIEQVLAMIGRGESIDIPVHRMLKEGEDAVHRRAQRLSETVGGDLEHAHVQRCESVIGGGSMPGLTMPSWGVRVIVPDPNAFSARMRSGSPAAFCRVEDDHVLFDLRTVTDAQVPDLARAIQYALEGDEFVEDD